MEKARSRIHCPVENSHKLQWTSINIDANIDIDVNYDIAQKYIYLSNTFGFLPLNL